MSVKEDNLPARVARSLFSYREDGRLVWQAKSAESANTLVGRVAGCVMPSTGYRVIRVFRTGYYEHRLIWLWHHGEWPDGEIDHINGDKTDNRIGNLRVVTRTQNQQNTKRFVTNRTGIKGVAFIAAKNRYRASIGYERKRIILGEFKTIEEASAAYAAAAATHHAGFQRQEHGQ